MHYFKRNIGDYHKKAGRLSMLEHGAYTLLIDACYDREKFPTIDEAIDWCWARTDQEICAVKFVLQKFFQLIGERYIQQRISDEITDYKEKAETNKNIAIERERRKKQRGTQNNNESLTESKDDSTDRARTVKENDDLLQDSAPNQEPRTKNHKPRTINQEPESNTSQPPAAEAEEKSNPVNRIFSCWQLLMKIPRAVLDDKRKKIIARALKLGYSEIDLMSAISGCSKDPWSMGFNERHKPFNEISIIFRDAEHIDKFIRCDQLPAAPMQNSSPPKKFDSVEYMNRPKTETGFDFARDITPGAEPKQIGSDAADKPVDDPGVDDGEPEQ